LLSVGISGKSFLCMEEDAGGIVSVRGGASGMIAVLFGIVAVVVFRALTVVLGIVAAVPILDCGRRD
jgi:hypothetical protein